jgi:hypothetical protein
METNREISKRGARIEVRFKHKALKPSYLEGRATASASKKRVQRDVMIVQQ